MSKKEPFIIKRDSRRNWNKSKYIPQKNVIIIMDNEDKTISLMVGDGETVVSELPDLLKAPNSFNNATVDEEGVLSL